MSSFYVEFWWKAGEGGRRFKESKTRIYLVEKTCRERETKSSKIRICKL